MSEEQTLGGFVVKAAIAEVKTIRVTNEHRLFARTPYASKSWWIEIRFIPPAKLEEALSRSRQGRGGETSVSGAYAKLFCEHVLDWNLLGEDGNVLDCSPETKRLVATQFTNLAVRVVDIAANKDLELLEEEEESGNV